jgi:hypothetical protein
MSRFGSCQSSPLDDPVYILSRASCRTNTGAQSLELSKTTRPSKGGGLPPPGGTGVDPDQLRLFCGIAGCVDYRAHGVRIPEMSSCAASNHPWATLGTFDLNQAITGLALNSVNGSSSLACNSKHGGSSCLHRATLRAHPSMSTTWLLSEMVFTMVNPARESSAMIAILIMLASGVSSGRLCDPGK